MCQRKLISHLKWTDTEMLYRRDQQTTAYGSNLTCYLFFLIYKVLLKHSHAYFSTYSLLPATTAKVNSCNRDYLFYKA